MKIRRIAVFAAVITLAAAPCAFAAEEAPAQTDAAAVTEESFVTQAETSKEEISEPSENEETGKTEAQAPEADDPLPEQPQEDDEEIIADDSEWIPLEDFPAADPDRIITFDEEPTEETETEPIEASGTVYYVELYFEDDEETESIGSETPVTYAAAAPEEHAAEDEEELVTISASDSDIPAAERPAPDEDGAQEPVGAIFALSALLASGLRFLMNSGIF